MGHLGKKKPVAIIHPSHWRAERSNRGRRDKQKLMAARSHPHSRNGENLGEGQQPETCVQNSNHMVLFSGSWSPTAAGGDTAGAAVGVAVSSLGDAPCGGHGKAATKSLQLLASPEGGHPLRMCVAALCHCLRLWAARDVTLHQPGQDTFLAPLRFEASPL